MSGKPIIVVEQFFHCLACDMISGEERENKWKDEDIASTCSRLWQGRSSFSTFVFPFFVEYIYSSKLDVFYSDYFAHRLSSFSIIAKFIGVIKTINNSREIWIKRVKIIVELLFYY